MPALSPGTIKDLERSGLTKATVEASGIRDEATDATVNALLSERYHVKGFVLPYFDLAGKELSFYRVKVLESLNGAKPAKYLQPKTSSTHLYVHPLILDLVANWATDPDSVLFITEGEKKALAGLQAGLPIIAVGGVYNWRTHVHTIERGYVRDEAKASTRIIHLDDRGEKAYRMEVAPELDGIEWAGRKVILLFDSDAETNPEVQRAAFELANWLGDKGAEPRQISLAGRLTSDGKVGLDDLLLADPSFAGSLLDPDWRAAEGFRPLPRDPLEWVSGQLNSGRVTRATQDRVAQFAIDWLDANGTRFMGVDGTYYFFDSATRVLHDFHPGTNLNTLRETSFGHLLVEQLGLDPADNSTVGRLIGRYPLGAPIITPHRVLAQNVPTNPDVIYYQISDADVIRVSKDGLEFVSNGDEDVLFYSGGVEPMDLDRLERDCNSWKPKQPLWYDALSTLNLDPLGELDLEQSRRLLTVLCYLSPWLNRWRGLMLPLEIAVGEANSGKTFQYNLRRGVLTGRTSLQGLPDDFRSWVAAVGAAPALWVCDNLGNVRSDYWHRLNDELARLITDPEPSIELRQLYTTATTLRVPVNTAFAITTVRNPFTAPDVLQRSLLYHLAAIPVGKRDPDWYVGRMKARSKWVAEHLNYLHRFLSLVDTDWEHNFQSGYRLVHFEQAVLLMGRALGWDMTKVVAGLPGVVAATVAEYDPVIEALSILVEEWNKPRRDCNMRDVLDWVEMDPGGRFSAIRQFANEIILGKYVTSHRYDIEQATGVTVIKADRGVTLVLP